MYIDLLTKIKNAAQTKKPSVKVSFTKMDNAIVEILVGKDLLKKAEVKGRAHKKYIQIELNPDKPIQGVKFLSRPSLRRYAGYHDILKVKGGHGLLVVSTPRGILSGEQAKKEKVGGQLLFEIW